MAAVDNIGSLALPPDPNYGIGRNRIGPSWPFSFYQSVGSLVDRIRMTGEPTSAFWTLVPQANESPGIANALTIDCAARDERVERGKAATPARPKKKPRKELERKSSVNPHHV